MAMKKYINISGKKINVEGKPIEIDGVFEAKSSIKEIKTLLRCKYIKEVEK